MQRVKALLFDAGWMRYGWPERVGGLGGSALGGAIQSSPTASIGVCSKRSIGLGEGVCA